MSNSLDRSRLDFEEFVKTFHAEDRFQRKMFKRYNKWLDEKMLQPYQVELLKLQKHLEEQDERMIILFEGRDAAGKGGTIRRVTRFMNEKHYRVVALGKPSDVQRTQWYFHRYIEQFPHGGEIVLFDRSWYNRTMVEPVFGFCTEEQYHQFMESVPRFEEELVESGFSLVKLYFSVTKEEQDMRFKERETNPLKQWKLSEIDVQMQEHWDEFTVMKYKMLKQTSTIKAPWTVIRSINKPLARINAIKVILNKIDYEGRNKDLDFSYDDNIVFSGAHEVENMEKELAEKGKFVG